MDSGYGNEPGWPDNTLLTYNLPAAAKLRESVVVERTQKGGMMEQPFRMIWEAEWNDIVCADYPLTPEQWLRECMRPLAGTQVDCLLYYLCSSDAYCCGLESGEILGDAFEQFEDAWVWRYRENTKKLIEANANPPALVCE